MPVNSDREAAVAPVLEEKHEDDIGSLFRAQENPMEGGSDNRIVDYGAFLKPGILNVGF